jgi:PAS domain S-box-containing protein
MQTGAAREDIMAIEDDVARALLASQGDGIMAVNASGEITLWSPACERIFGFTAAEAVGGSLEMIIPENQRERHWTGFDKTMETGETKFGGGDLLSVPALTKDGRRISAEFTIALLLGEDGKPVGMVSIVRDASKAFDERRILRRRVAELGG